MRTEQDPGKRKKNRIIGIVAAAVLTVAVIALAAVIILKIRNSGTYVLVKYQEKDDEEAYYEMEYDSAGHKAVWQSGSNGSYIKEPGRFLWSAKHFDPAETVNGVTPVVLYNMDDPYRSLLSYPMNEFLWENDIEEIELVFGRGDRLVYSLTYKDNKVSGIYYERNGSFGGDIGYSYNRDGKLVEVNGKDGQNYVSYSLDYDSKGRLSQLSHISLWGEPERETYSYNSQGDLETIISYDWNGDVLSKMQISYDRERIDKIFVEGGGADYEYVFDYSDAPKKIRWRERTQGEYGMTDISEMDFYYKKEK